MCAVFYKRLYTVTRDCFMEDADHARRKPGKEREREKTIEDA